MEGNKKNKETVIEPLKEEKKYKVTCGTFKAREEALQRAAGAKGRV